MDFDEIEDTYIPGCYVEIDNSLANQGLNGKEGIGLLIGQKLAGELPYNTLSPLVRSADEAAKLAGTGSELHRMAKAWFRYNGKNKLYLIAPEQTEGTAAVYKLTVTAEAAKDGMINLLIGGQAVKYTVSEGNTAAEIATGIAQKINAMAELPVTAATGDAGALTLTAKHSGENGNFIDIRLNYFDGETTAAGVSVDSEQITKGAGNVSLEETIAALGDAKITAVATSYTDMAHLKLLEAEVKRRFNAMVCNEMCVYAVLKGTLSEMITAKGQINHQCIGFLMDYKSPNMPEERAAVYAAVSTLEYQKDPARQIATLELPGDVPAKTELTANERNMLLTEGIGTVVVNANGNTAIEREATAYRHNSLGAFDKSYFDMTTTQTLIYLRFSYVERICSKYQRYKLANDDYEVAPGQKVVTPLVLKAEILALAEDWYRAGLVEDLSAFKETLISERSLNDPERINQLLQPNIVNNLRIVAGKLQFIL